jgi:hypothetical protein
MVHNGTCYQPGEKGYEKAVVQKVIFTGLPVIGVDEEGYLLEREETNSERKYNSLGLKSTREEKINIVDEEMCIFVVSKKPKVENDATYQCSSC